MRPTFHDHLFLDNDSTVPIYRQIHLRLREGISAGRLRAGERVPSTRALAQQLGLARGTVAAAYALLTAEGYLEAHGQAGSQVAEVRLASRAGGVAEETVLPQAFQMGLPALDAFPRKAWGRLAARAARATQVQHMVMAPPSGMPALRAAIADYLGIARGIDCLPAQVFVSAGYGSSMQLILRALLEPGEQVWVEDPGYPATAALVRTAGLMPVPVPVDQDGLQIAAGLAQAPAARAAVLTPSHQYPLGVAMSAQRRHALLEWAARHGGWLIEDDYNGEFRYAGRPLPALASWDAAGRVVYCGSFSQLLFPAIRLAFVVTPPALVERFERVCSLVPPSCPALTQTIVSDFMQNGHFARHVRQMRKLYGERRQFLVNALADVLGDRLPLAVSDGGMHLLAATAPGADRTLALRMRRQGMAPQALSDWYAEAPSQSGLLLGFTNIASEAQAKDLCRRMAGLMRE